jgi:hypothetical protein
MAGFLVLTAGFGWLLFRVSGAKLTRRERIGYPVMGILLLLWVVFLVIVGPEALPLPLLLVLNLVVLGGAVWIWRRREAIVEGIPPEDRLEVRRRQQRLTPRILALLTVGFVAATLAWTFVVSWLFRDS